jgi:pyrroloquinoline quinone biosynthesis protein E
MENILEAPLTPPPSACMTALPEHNPALRSLPEPEPSLGREAYLRERELALTADPLKRANYEKFIKSGRRSAEVDYLPITLDIENISRCNFRCVMCTVSAFPKGRRARDMTIEELRQLIDEQQGLVEIKLHGLGEPLLQGDTYYEMIRYARSKHIWVRTVTNASALHANNNARKLVDSGINEIQISIDGADKQTFESIRRGGHFQRVADNCRIINAYCRERGLPLTKMWTVVQKENAHQLPELVDFAAEVGFPCQVFSLQMHGWGNAELEKANNTRSMDGGLEVPRLLELVDRGAKQGVKVAFWNITAKYSTSSPAKMCPWPFERSYVSSEGRNVPCCMIGNPDNYEIAPGKSLKTAWNAAEYQEFRRMHLEDRLPDVCKACYQSRS